MWFGGTVNTQQGTFTAKLQIVARGGGTVDSVLMRLVDAAFTFPAILFALLLAVTMGQGLGTLVIAISLLLWAPFARVIRGEVLALRQRDFVALAKVRGCSSLGITMPDSLLARADEVIE